jgi:mRNA interferase RelE/StbE
VSFDVRLSRSAERYLERLPRDAQARIVERLAQLATDPFGPYTKPMQGTVGDRSSRVGGWRIIFEVNRDRRVVDVSDIGPRGQIYRRL